MFHFSVAAIKKTHDWTLCVGVHDSNHMNGTSQFILHMILCYETECAAMNETVSTKMSMP